MDLRLFFRVVSRFRYLVAAGLLLACALTFVSLFTVSFHGGKPRIAYRQGEIYQAYETLWFTQSGCGQQCYSSPPFRVNQRTGQITFLKAIANFSTLAQLAQFYAQFATSDTIETLVRKNGPLPGSYTASTVIDESSPQLTLEPFMRIRAVAASPRNAVVVARRASNAVRQYVADSQESSKVPPASRAVVVVAQEARSASLFQGRRLTVPIVVFLSVLIATLVLAFLLENLRPRARLVPAHAEATAAGHADGSGDVGELHVRLEDAATRLEDARPVEHEELLRARAATRGESTRK